jgi:hypothetical protein
MCIFPNDITTLINIANIFFMSQKPKIMKIVL